MTKRKKFGRRKSDRAILVVAITGMLGLYMTYTQSCDGSKSPTMPDPVVVSTPAPQQVTPVVITPEPSPDPGGGPGPTSVVCDAAGTCTFTTTIPHHVSAVCTSPLHTNDWGSWNAVVKTGDTVSVYSICDPVKIGVDLCEGGERKVQVDFTAGQGEHIGHWGLGGQKLVYAPDEQYCECEPGEWEIIKRGEPEEGDVVECSQIDLPSLLIQAPCFECFEISTTVTKSNGCEEREWIITEIDQREVECPCEEEWIPQEPVIEEGAFGDCTATGEDENGRPTCTRTQSISTTTCEVNSCTQEERCETIVTANSEPCECETEGLCYYRVSCGEQEEDFVAFNRECDDQAQQSICEGEEGIWLNFDGGALDNHCQFDPPGISHDDFQLTPGQSDTTCLNKNDD